MPGLYAPLTDVNRPPVEINTTNCFPWPLRASESLQLTNKTRIPRSTLALACRPSQTILGLSSKRGIFQKQPNEDTETERFTVDLTPDRNDSLARRATPQL